jgi:hypothetical protein
VTTAGGFRWWSQRIVSSSVPNTDAGVFQYHDRPGIERVKSSRQGRAKHRGQLFGSVPGRGRTRSQARPVAINFRQARFSERQRSPAVGGHDGLLGGGLRGLTEPWSAARALLSVAMLIVGSVAATVIAFYVNLPPYQ